MKMLDADTFSVDSDVSEYTQGLIDSLLQDEDIDPDYTGWLIMKLKRKDLE